MRTIRLMVDAILLGQAWRAGAVLAIAEAALPLAEQLVRSGAAVWADYEAADARDAGG